MTPPRLLLCSLLALSCLSACSLSHPEPEHCKQSCIGALRSLSVDLAPPDFNPSKEFLESQACIDACLHNTIPIEYHCLARSHNSDDVQSCFERPRTNAYRLEHLRVQQESLAKKTPSPTSAH